MPEVGEGMGQGVVSGGTIALSGWGMGMARSPKSCTVGSCSLGPDRPAFPPAACLVSLKSLVLLTGCGL